MTAVDSDQAREDTGRLEKLVAPRPGMGPIVVGVDGSMSSAAALAWAVSVATTFDAEIVVVHALPLSAEIVQDCPPVGLKDWRAVLRAKLSGPWCAPLREAGVAFRVKTVHRSPGAALLDVISEVDADLVVVGARQHRHSHHAGGSLSHHLVRRAPCPVVTVPA